jgi:CheY-like chemotaxis protein
MSVVSAGSHQTLPVVLVTDDDMFNRRLLSRMLAQLGCQVETAEHGAQAVERVQSKTFDALIMDISM